MKKVTKITASKLKKLGVPAAAILGLLLAYQLGWDGKALEKVKDYYQIKEVFPESDTVKSVEDGDTFVLNNDIKVRMIGINAEERGQNNYLESKNKLTNLIGGKKVYLEYDRYPEDKFSRVLAWIWIDCKKNPKFLPANYMHKSSNESMPGLTENPEGCKNGKLVNEEMIKSGSAEIVVYKDRGETKYEKRLLSILDTN